MSLDGLMTVVTVAINEAFGSRVRAVLDERALSLRQGRIRTGIDIETLSRMRQGEVPRLDKVEAFARGFGLDINEWRVLAGYESLTGHGSGADALWDGLLTLQQEHPDHPIPLPQLRGGWRNVTPEQAALILDDMRDKLRRGVL